jgi:hypothetical protein
MPLEGLESENESTRVDAHDSEMCFEEQIKGIYNSNLYVKWKQYSFGEDTKCV